MFDATTPRERLLWALMWFAVPAGLVVGLALPARIYVVAIWAGGAVSIVAALLFKYEGERVARAAIRHRLLMCTSCFYPVPMSGPTGAGRCPECGRFFSGKQLRAAWHYKIADNALFRCRWKRRRDRVPGRPQP